MSLKRQLMEQIVNITPQNCDELIEKIISILKQTHLPQVLLNIVKSLFYGLWNFDKMINQHNLSTKIANILHQIPIETANQLLLSIFQYLTQKWDYIDQHRINKFMQLVRYLLRQSFNLHQKNTNHSINSSIDSILLKTVFQDLSTRSGLAYHIVEIYYQVITDILSVRSKKISPDNLTLFEQLLKSHTVQHFRLHIIDKVYSKFKENANPDEITVMSQRISKMAIEESKDLYRKNMYYLVGFLKKEEKDFSVFMQRKNEKKANEQKLQRKRKVISKQKKQLIKKAKESRKIERKKLKKAKTTSKKKSQMKYSTIIQ